MGIVSFVTDTAGQVNVNPRRVKMITTDSLATITTAGYLNKSVLAAQPIFPTDLLDVDYSFVQATGASTYGEFSPSITNGIITLVSTANSNITLPTIANHIATYTNTTGGLSEDPATAISGGNIQAGLSGTAGTLASFPATAANGKLVVAAVNNSAGNFNTTISNASSVGQSQVVSIPDSGVAAANFLVSDSAGTQLINTGNLTLTAGNLTATAGNIVATAGNITATAGNITATAGNVQAGSSGHAGTLASFPSTAARGSLIIAGVANTGNTNTTLSNAAMGQASTINIPDPANATGQLLIGATATPFVSGNIPQASGTGGLMVDSGVAGLNLTMTKVFTLTSAQLATAGKVNIQVHSSGTSQYFIQDIKVLKSTGLSGGGGDRLLSVADGTLAFNNAGITAALLGTPIFTIWGGTGNPIAAGTSDVSTAGADIFFQYIGGTTDYAAGSVQVAVTYVKVTA